MSVKDSFNDVGIMVNHIVTFIVVYQLAQKLGIATEYENSVKEYMTTWDDKPITQVKKELTDMLWYLKLKKDLSL